MDPPLAAIGPRKRTALCDTRLWLKILSGPLPHNRWNFLDAHMPASIYEQLQVISNNMAFWQV